MPRVAHLGSLATARALLADRELLGAWNATVAAVQCRPFHPEAYLLLANIAAQAGDYETARACALKAGSRWRTVHELLQQWPAVPGRKQNWPELPVAPQLSVCLITRNEENFLGQCLASVTGIADQIVVVDTGSTDRTVALAREHGAEVHTTAWEDDFSAARNLALAHAHGQWVLILDADEELSATGRAALSHDLADSGVMAYRLPLINAGEEPDGACYVPRLFRNAPGIFFVGRIHEQAFASFEARRRDWGLENRLGTATLIHHGYRAATKHQKNTRNLRLLEAAVAESPHDINLVMNHGLELVRAGRPADGLARYKEALQLLRRQPPDQVSPELRETLLTQLSGQLLASGDFVGMAALFESAPARAHGLTATMHFNYGLALLKMGQPGLAAEQFRQCLAKRDQATLTPVPREVRGSGPQHCLAMCLALQGQEVTALKLLQALAMEQGSEPAVWLTGGEIALSRTELWPVADDWTAAALQRFPAHTGILEQRAKLSSLRGRSSDAGKSRH